MLKVKLFLKILIAVGIFYWLVDQDKLDFSLLLKSFERPYLFLAAVILICLQLLISAYRFFSLLKLKPSDLTFKSLIGIQWISLLFSAVLPGSVTSDLIKIKYLKDIDKKVVVSYALFILFFDRLMGLSSLLFATGLVNIFFIKNVMMDNTNLKIITLMNVLLFFLSILGIIVFLFQDRLLQPLLRKIKNQRMHNFFAEISVFNHHKIKIMNLYLYSVFSHFLLVLSFWYLSSPFFEKEISFQSVVSLFSLGQLATFFPITPGGLGVGHASFSILFETIGHYNGASLYNIYWVTLLAIKIFGIIPFLIMKEKRDREHQ